MIAGDILATGDLFEIPFGPTENDLIISEVEVRFPAGSTTRLDH